jgi:hypothetical protein
MNMDNKPSIYIIIIIIIYLREAGGMEIRRKKERKTFG